MVIIRGACCISLAKLIFFVGWIQQIWLVETERILFVYSYGIMQKRVLFFLSLLCVCFFLFLVSRMRYGFGISGFSVSCFVRSGLKNVMPGFCNCKLHIYHLPLLLLLPYLFFSFFLAKEVAGSTSFYCELLENLWSC